MTTFTEKTFQAPHCTIHYAEGPPGGVPLLYLHGFSSRWQIALPTLGLLAHRYHVFAPDLRGHGQSGRTPGAYGLAHDADDMLALLQDIVQRESLRMDDGQRESLRMDDGQRESLRMDDGQRASDVGKSAVVVGHSYGAFVAICLAARAPQAVKGLFLGDPPFAEMTDNRAHTGRFRTWFGAIYESMTREDSPAGKLAALRALTPDADELTHRRRLAQWSHLDPERLLWATEGKLTGDLKLVDLLPQITCPVLLLQCDPDQGGALDHATTQLIRELLADCIHVYRPDLTHHLDIDQPLELAKMVTAFAELL